MKFDLYWGSGTNSNYGTENEDGYLFKNSIKFKN